MTKNQYIKRLEGILINTPWDKRAEALYQLHIEGVRDVIGGDQGYLEANGQDIDEEDAEKFNKLIENRNELRREQRERLKK